MASRPKGVNRMTEKKQTVAIKASIHKRIQRIALEDNTYIGHVIEEMTLVYIKWLRKAELEDRTSTNLDATRAELDKVEAELDKLLKDKGVNGRKRGRYKRRGE